MITDLIKELNEKGIQLTFESGVIKYSGPQDQITPEIISRLKQNKETLKRYLWPIEKSNLIPVNLDGDKPPLILVHGGNSVNFLSDYFEGERPIYNFLDIGSNGERITSKSIEEMAQHYVDQLLSLVPIGPYIFCGFSFGGLLTYKMAELLSKQNGLVNCIIMLDTSTPQVKVINKFKRFINDFNSVKLYDAIIKRVDFIKYHYALIMNRNKPIPAKYRSKYIESTYTKLAKSYMPSNLDVNMLLFRANENITIDPKMGWGDLVKNLKIISIDGGHTGILFLEQNYKIIPEEIDKFISDLSI